APPQCPFVSLPYALPIQSSIRVPLVTIKPVLHFRASEFQSGTDNPICALQCASRGSSVAKKGYCGTRSTGKRNCNTRTDDYNPRSEETRLNSSLVKNSYA